MKQNLDGIAEKKNRQNSLRNGRSRRKMNYHMTLKCLSHTNCIHNFSGYAWVYDGFTPLHSRLEPIFLASASCLQIALQYYPKSYTVRPLPRNLFRLSVAHPPPPGICFASVPTSRQARLVYPSEGYR